MVCFGTALRFKPCDKQILAHLLFKVNKKQEIPCNDHDFKMIDLYGETEPWDINIDPESRNGQEDFYFTKRKKRSSSGNNTLDEAAAAGFNMGIGKGRWQVCGPKKRIADKKNQELGFKQCYRYKNEEEIRADRDLGNFYIMEEYTLAERFSACVTEEYEDCALCSIREETGINLDIDGLFDQVLSENQRASKIGIGKWSKLGNHPAMIFVWAILGLVGSTTSLVYFSEPNYYAPYMVAAFCATSAVYALGFVNRRMRERRNWWQSAGCNLIVSGITIFSSYLHKASTDAMIGQSLIAVSVFGFMEIAKPVFDFGLLQYFLRIPLLSAVQLSPHRVFKWHFITGVVLVFGTLWQAYYLHLFNQQIEKERYEEEAAARFHEDREPVQTQGVVQDSQGVDVLQQTTLDHESQLAHDQSPTPPVE